MFAEHDRIVLTSDIGAADLRAGDVGTIVDVYRDSAAFEVEFLALDGHSAAVAKVRPSQMRAVGPADVTHVGEVTRSNRTQPRGTS